VPHEGRLAARLVPGTREVVFRYRPLAARMGAGVSAISLALLILA
jgi:hypothetical protein